MTIPIHVVLDIVWSVDPVTPINAEMISGKEEEDRPVWMGVD